ncbi:MAG: hypothetical protein WCF67_20335, partial [Chitinophagaceae bacterium]
MGTVAFLPAGFNIFAASDEFDLRIKIERMLKVVGTRIALVLFCLFLVATGFAQQQRFPVMDKSPMDVSYYPANYPILKIQDRLKKPDGSMEPLIARVVY